MSDQLDVYQKWLGIPPHQQPPHHYRLLGIELFESDPDTIAYAADRQMAHVRTFQQGDLAQTSQHLLNEIAKAKLELLHPERRARYDQQLQANLTAQQTAMAAPRQSSERMPAGAMPSEPTTAAPQQMVPPVQAQPSEPDAAAGGDQPLWRNPAVIGGGATCLVLLVAIMIALATRGNGNSPSDSGTTGARDTNSGRDHQEQLASNDSEGFASSGSAASDDTSKYESQEAGFPEHLRHAPPPEKLEPIAGRAGQGETDTKQQPVQRPPGETEQLSLGAEKPASVSDDPVGDTTREKKTPGDPLLAGQHDPASSGGAVSERQPADASADPAGGAAPSADQSVASLDQTASEPAEKPVPADGNGTAGEEPAEGPVVRERRPLPTEEDRRQARQTVREIFAKEYASAKTREAKVQLARYLHLESKRLDQDTAGRLALLEEARELAEEGTAHRLALALIDQATEDYEFDALQEKVESLSKILLSASSKVARHQIALTLLELVDDAIRAHRFDLATKLASQSQALAQRVRDGKLVAAAKSAGLEIKEARARWQEVQDARQKLQQSPADAAANLVYGRFLCLAEGDWEQGLVHLAEGSDPLLRAAAEADLAEPQALQEQIAAGDLWYDAATSSDDNAGFRVREHHWYSQALPEATGLDRTKIEKRLQENPTVKQRRASIFLPGGQFGSGSD